MASKQTAADAARWRTPAPPMSDVVFRKLGRFVEEHAGIRMPPVKKIMLQGRLQKRLRELGMPSYDAYLEYLFSSTGQQAELQKMIDVVTTNKTDFFREPHHFEYLRNEGLQQLSERFGERLRCWSAPCSKGHEPYTLAMVLAEFGRARQGFDYSILGTDLSSRVLEQARRAVYPLREVEPVPAELHRRYLMRSRDPGAGTVRIVPELRAKVTFRQLNFMDQTFHLPQPYHLVLCRNVLIYFERPVQEQVINRIARHLRPGGLLFTGHSETLNGMDVPFVQLSPTIYQREKEA